MRSIFKNIGNEFHRLFGRIDISIPHHKFFENVDVFDSYGEHLSPEVVKLPEYQIDCGFDHKENLLKKTGQLGLYGT